MHDTPPLRRLSSFGTALVFLAGCGDPRGGPPKLLLGGAADVPLASGVQIDVDPFLARVYVGGGMGQSGLAVVDVSVPSAITASAFGGATFGGGVAVDLATGLVATTDGVTGGGGAAQLAILDAAGVTRDQETVPGCGGGIVAGGGLFGVSVQCTDSFLLYDIASGAVVFQTAAGGTAASPAFNAATGRWYWNRTPRAGGPRDVALVASPTAGGVYVVSDLPVDGLVAGADPLRSRVWMYDQTTPTARPLIALDGTTHQRLSSVAPLTTTAGAIALAGAIDVIFHDGFDGRVRAFEAGSGLLIDELDFATASGGFSSAGTPIATDGRRAYLTALPPAAGPVKLFVITLFGR